jgi:hypothetical protein
MDFGRLRTASAGPGADTRTWVVLARVDDDDDAIRWDSSLGWLVDVTVQGGPLDQEGPIVCRCPSDFVEDSGAKLDPPIRDCIAVVVLPEGDANVDPSILGFVQGPGCSPPNSVNGDDIDEAKALGAHVLVTSKEVDWEVAGNIRLRTTGDAARFLGPLVELADEGATEPYVLGNANKDAVDAFAQSVQSAFTDLVPPGPPATPVTAAQATAAVATITVAIVQLSLDLQNALSTKIKGE